jgi:FAD-dependent urate hydroxylase
MHALVIGGGIAGPLAAMGLLAEGWDATVYEAHGERGGTSIGAWLTVAVNGLDAMAALGVDRAVIDCGFESRTIELTSGSGKLLGAVPIGGERPGGLVTHTMRRTALYASIAGQAAARGVRFAYGKRLLDAVPHGDRVEAIFADGSRASGELLIGADGVHSQVRRLIDPNAPAPRYAGLTNVGGFTPCGRVALAPGIYRMVFGRRAFFGYTVAPDGEIWWFVNEPRARELERAEIAASSPAQWKQRMAELFRDDDGPMAEIIAAADDPLVLTNQHELPRVPTWRRGAMLLLGDAAHAVSPSSGQGVSMAAEDAVALAKCVSEASGVADALAQFEAMRRARVERVVAYGASMGASKTAGPIGRVLRDLFLPLVLRRIARRSGEGSLAWLYDHHIDWTAGSWPSGPARATSTPALA